MAVKWYRSLIEPSGDPRGEIKVAKAEPGEVFQFDYDRPGFGAQPLIDNGIIEELKGDPTNEDLARVAKRLGHAGVESMKKEELLALLDSHWEV